MIDCKPLPEYDFLHSVFEYRDGNLYRKIANSPFAKVGEIAGGLSEGYVRVRINNVRYKAHRIIWKMVTGKDPVGIIDHIDKNPSNNRFENLRDTNHSINALNKNSKGYSYKKSQGKWAAWFKVGGKQVHLGYFDTAEEASSRYQEFKELYMEMVNANPLHP